MKNFSREILHVALLLGTVFIFSCDEQDGSCFSGQGENKEMLVNLPDINTLVTYDIFDIALVQDTINYLILEAGENILSSISIDTFENTLVLDSKLPCRWSKGYPVPKITLHFTRLNKLDLKEPCTVYSEDTLSGTSLGVALWTGMIDMDLILNYGSMGIGTSRNIAGKVTLSGMVGSLRITGRGALAVDAGNMIVQNVDTENNSIADFYFKVSNRITARLKNTGNIYCKGNPNEVIVQVKEDTGDLILIDD